MARKLYSFILFYFFTFSFSQNVTIPDQIFKAYLLNINPTKYQAKDLQGNFTSVDLNNDGEIQVIEAENISYLATTYQNNIIDITGIEAFKNLTELNIEHNTNLKTLSLSNNTKLKKIKGLYNKALESINIENSILLEELDLFDTIINSVNVTNNTKLKKLVITGQYNSLDLSKNINLEEIRIGSNYLKSLNLDNCNLLTKIRIDDDDLVTFNFSPLQGLQDITFANTNMASIDFSNSNVMYVNFWYNSPNLNSLLLPLQNSNLRGVNIPENINSIDLTNSLNLEYFSISNNKISSLDFSKNLKLKKILISDSNLISSINVSQNINLETLNVFRLPNLSSIYIKNGKKQNFDEGFLECPKLNYVCCDENEKDFFINKGIPNVTTDCLLASQEVNSLNDFKIYPNPSSDYLNFNHKIEYVKIFDIQGKLVLNRKINSNNLNISELKNGVYIVEVFSENKKSSQKFIKK